MKIEQALLTPNRWSRPQTKINTVKGVVIHWVANPNSTHTGNRNFFENRKLGKTNFGSAHYIVGLQGQIIQCLPDSEMAYHVGSNVYTQHAKNRLGSYPNNSTLGIECTHTDIRGKMTPATYNATLELAVKLLKENGLTENDLWLHQTVVGWKDCHRFFVENPTEWIQFKKLAGEMLRGKAVLNPEVDIKDLVITDDYAPVNTLLRVGSRGAEVKSLQEKLNAKGFNAGTADGIFGTNTEKAVIAFQKASNIGVDGIVGAQTLKALDAYKKPAPVKTPAPAKAPTPAPTQPANRTLRVQTPMLNGNDVKRVQKAVGVKQDGWYGNDTANAVKLFQAQHKLGADGIVGAQTWKAIDAGKVYTKPAPKPKLAVAKPTLRMGSRGMEVTKLQATLNALGFNCGKADGIFGNGTVTGVKAFQRNAKIGVDGIYGKGSETALKKRV